MHATTSLKLFCIRVLSIVFSHVGLPVIFVAYSVAGAFLFQILEEHNEKTTCIQGKGNESTTIVILITDLITTTKYNVSANNNESQTTVNDWLLDFRDNVLALESEYAYAGQDCNSTNSWDFTKSWLFALTTITTIGNE
jgi:hypothetical protein